MRSLIVSLLFIASTVLAADKPNILFISIDDLNHWVGYLGRNKQTITPNIDKLAARGVRFSRSYCAAPVCNPSRAALMSGMRPGVSGVYDNNQDWRQAIAISKPLTTTFRNAGYEVLGAGKIYHEAYKRDEEWSGYLKNEGGMPKVPEGQSDGVGGIKFAALKDAKDEDFNDWNIVSYCIDQLGKAHDKPLFLACGIHKPHMPWNVPQKYFDMHPLDQIELPPTKPGDLDDVPPAGLKMANPKGDHAAMLASGRWKEAVQAYLAAASYCDMLVGRLMDALDKSAYKDNTVIVFWGDHGWHLGEKEHWRKFALWEEATRAPLIWVAPGVTKPNSLCERTVDLMSVYPTLLDLCGIDKPVHVEGPSLKPLLVDPLAKWDLPAVTTFGYQNHAVRTEGWRYIRYANGDEELYDENADPYEWTNLANKPEHAALKAELAKHLPATNHEGIASKPGKNKDGKGKKKGKNKSVE